MLPPRPKPVVNSSFLSATPSLFVSVYFHTSSLFVSLVRMASAPNGIANRGNRRPSTNTVWCSNVPSPSRSSWVEIRPVGTSESMPSGRLLVAAELEEEHAAVAVECHLPWRVDQRIGQHRLEPVSGGQPELLRLLVGGQRPDRRPWGEIGLGVRGILRVGRGEGSGSPTGALNGAGPALGVNRNRSRGGNQPATNNGPKDHDKANSDLLRARNLHRPLLHAVVARRQRATRGSWH